MLDYPSC